MTTSVLIPAREEPYLARTVRDVLAHARGPIEVRIGGDGWLPPAGTDTAGLTDPRVHVRHWTQPVGLRNVLNALAAEATGDFLLKLDAHCAVSEGFDVTLAEACGERDVVVPSKYSLDPELWTRFKAPWQYFYLTFPYDNGINHVGLHDKNCPEAYHEAHRAEPEPDILSYQGSCWGLRKTWWAEVGPMNHAMYYTAQEPQEIGLATWLQGGRVRCIKRVWYAHLWKGHSNKRGFPTIKPRWVRALAASANYWMAQPGLAALVGKFWDVLKGCEYGPWPVDWQDPRWKRASDAYRAEHGA